MSKLKISRLERAYVDPSPLDYTWIMELFSGPDSDSERQLDSNNFVQLARHPLII